MKPTDVPILMYHNVGDHDSPWCVSCAAFAAQMEFLVNEGYHTISMSALQEAISQNNPLPDKTIVLTFDDAREGVFTYAYHILKKCGFTATIYIVPSWVRGGDDVGVSKGVSSGSHIPTQEAYSTFMSWEMLYELAANGFEMGSHSYSHQNMGALTDIQVGEELERADTEIIRHLGQNMPCKKVEHFSYPFGAMGEQVTNAIQSRYLTGVTTQRGFQKTAGQFARQWVLRETSLEMFSKLVRRPSLSLAMIVKNEAGHLGECLNSVQGLVDEIVIVDTGSIDNTKEIAAQFTNKIFNFTWCDDFAAARNYALEQAKGDWVLVLDADEVVALEDHALILEAVNNWDVRGYRILTKNYTNNPSLGGWLPVSAEDPSQKYAQDFLGWIPSLKVRLFQRPSIVGDELKLRSNEPSHSQILFEGRVHETVDRSITRSGGQIRALPLVIHHYGHHGGGEKKKIDYYLELSKKQVLECPEEIESLVQLGLLYKEAGNYVQAIRVFEDVLAREPSMAIARLNLAVSEQKQGGYEKAIEHYLLVLPKGSEKLEKPERNVSSELGESKWRAQAYFGLGFCYFSRQDMVKAANYFHLATLCNPSYAEAYINLGAVCERLGDYTRGLEALRTALTLVPRAARAHYNIGVIYENMHSFPLAIAYYERAVEHHYPRKADVQQRIEKLRRIITMENDGPDAAKG